ncbi:LXG domain-containing protein [Streptococcus cristatus]|uniref:LXG domain-containing protein n=1 Tax=Streptococcus cristatus TaxID=45634 RepID=UPI0021AE04D1|nr:LXG domain-containing protein [Streptococcus cristatus]
MKEVYEQKTALSNSKTSIDAQLKTAKTSFVNLVHSESLKGDVKGAINAKITNHQVPLLTNFTNALAVLLAQYEKTIKQFQSTVSENAVDAIIDTEYLQGLLDGFSDLETNISTVDKATANIYSSISDIISLTNPDASTITTPLSEGKKILTDTKTNMASFNGWKRGDEFDKVMTMQTQSLENLDKFKSSDFNSKDAKAFYNDKDFVQDVKKITENVNSSTPLGLLTSISKLVITLNKWEKRGTKFVKAVITYLKEIKYINGRKIIVDSKGRVQIGSKRQNLYSRNNDKVYKRGKEFQTQTKQSDIRKTNIGRGVKMTGWKNAWADARKSGAAAAKDSFKSGLNPFSDFKGFKEASKWAKGGKFLGAAGSISSIVMNFKESFFDDETSTTGQKLRNFAVNQTVDTVSSAGAAYAGAAIGTMIGGPLGTVIGAGAGIAISAFLDYKWGGEKGSSIKDMTKDALKGATNAIGDGFKTVAGWFS